jgi:hypothetical protein
MPVHANAYSKKTTNLNLKLKAKQPCLAAKPQLKLIKSKNAFT